MHACALADLVGISTVIVPARAGVLCAVGLLASPVQHDLVRSTVEGTDVDAALDQLRREAAEAFAGSVDVEIVTAVDCRYPGQSHEITVPTAADFHAEHERRNGYARPDAHVEVVALRASARVASPVDIEALPSTDRAPVRGPVVVSEADCTIWVPDGWKGEPGAAGALVLTRT
jgi:N-methylhydantoinase A/oxoprolinase/acetone carboxylase beta subunit